MNWKQVPIPPKMQDLSKDPRGYPIPFVVLVDNQDTAHFKINDSRKQLQALQQGLCHVCGKKLRIDDLWLLGGPKSAFHPHGCYIDGPTHYQCGSYALQVCPYLSAAKYRHTTDVTEITPKTTSDGVVVGTFVDPTMEPERPEFFIYARTSRIYLNLTTMYMTPEKPWLEVEYWQQGKQTTRADFDQWLLTAELPSSLIFPE